MTPEFKKWYANLPVDVSYLDPVDAHILISAFVGLLKDVSHGVQSEADLYIAFNKIVREFALDGDK
jgi:hypothetical protein